MPVIINHYIVSSILQTDASALTGKKRTTAKQTWAIHYKDKILTDLSLQTHWKFESLLPQQFMIPEDHRKDWKQEWLPVAGKVSRLLSVLILNLEGRSLQSSEKEKIFSGATQSFWNNIVQNPRSLLSKWNIPFVHLDFSCKYLVLCLHFCMWIKHNFKQEHTTLYHWKHWVYVNSWLRLSSEQSE